MKQIQLADAQLHGWVEQDSSVHIKAMTGIGDPVELSDVEVAKLIAFLQACLDEYVD